MLGNGDVNDCDLSDIGETICTLKREYDEYLHKIDTLLERNRLHLGLEAGSNSTALSLDNAPTPRTVLSSPASSML